MGWFTKIRRKFSASATQDVAPAPAEVESPVVADGPAEPSSAPVPDVVPESEPAPDVEPEPQSAPEPVAESVPQPVTGVEPVAPAERTVLDLSGVDSVRVRIVATDVLLGEEERESVDRTEYLVVREPADVDAVSTLAVFDGERKIGYLSPAKADLLVPLLDSMPADAFRIAGDPDVAKPEQFWAFIPRVPALRAHAQSLLADSAAR
ncbi:hypothetical protein SAMN04489860_0814 [Paraoerskovia marina]|uniref:HIRAN domain-containing protein n=1 Tax=Paraoerskovia marina TaxID=545619 RepID=A0A1H1PJS7_9CELL|nr:hypothetical protein [Paraoerskovia marina]SDS10959.1 hypothetical protein SAMN04489860_0814 [Paraoerskovia marina]